MESTGYQNIPIALTTKSQPIIKPLTLNIVNKSEPISITNNNLNYTPITKIISQNENIIEPWHEKSHHALEQDKAEKNRRYKAKYDERVRKYIKIANLKTEKDKLREILLICYPTLTSMASHELEYRIMEFINSLNSPIFISRVNN